MPEEKKYLPQFDKDNGYVVSDRDYDVCRGPNKSVVTCKEIQKVLLDMLIELDRVFRKNNVPYALAFGGALGVYNYHGFIPWDDDSDIVIMHEDLPKAIEALKNDLSDEYYFDCYETDEMYNVFYPTIKVRKKNTYIKESVEFFMRNRCASGNGIFIDIVTMMGVAPNKKEQFKYVKRAKWNAFKYSCLDMVGHNSKKIKRRMKEMEQEVFEKYKDSNMIGQTPIIPYQDKGGGEISFPKEIILPFNECEFEGHMFYSFNNIEKFCQLFYKNDPLKKWENNEWVDKYPLKKRKPDHYSFVNLYGVEKK